MKYLNSFKKINFLFIIFFIVSNYCVCQVKNIPFEKSFFKDNKKILKEALNEIEKGDKLYEEGMGKYKIALNHYLAANKLNPDNAMLNFKIGVCYLNTILKENALHHLEKASHLDPNVDPKISYLLGQAYQLNLDWKKAISEYNNYKKTLTPEDWEKNASEVLKRIDECKNGIELMKNPVRVFIDNIGNIVNSVYPDYVPVISADESVMMFTSRRDNTTGGQKSDFDFEYFEDVYIAYNKDGNWSAPQNMGEPINTGSHDATIGLSPDAQKLLIYRSSGKDGGDIYFCELKGDKWSKPERFPKNINTEHHESSACFSFDERTLYFVSNKPDGLGGHDIYKCELNKKGKWGKAENIGAPINTLYDDEAVFLHPDGKTMYFSSRGHKTMGGFDIFKSVFENGKWSEPQNLGYPVNTPDDDIYFVVSASGRRAYYASGKKGGMGEKDIYVITFLGAEKPVVLNTEDNLLANVSESVSEVMIEPEVEIKTNSVTLLKGFVHDAVTLMPLESDIEIVDNEKKEVIATFKSNSKTGKYLVTLPSGKNYGIAVKSENYLFHSENVDIPVSTGYLEVEKNIGLKKVVVGSKIVLKNIFFDFDKATLRPESTAELDRLIKLLNDIPSLRIELSGHTDNRGKDEYNQNLSERRAKAVVDYLIQKEINTSRLEYKGYGEIQPIATNDTDEGRQLNRRTEFKVLSK